MNQQIDMKQRGGIVLALLVVLGVVAGAAVLLHLPATQPFMEQLHAVHAHIAGFGRLSDRASDATRRAHEGVAAIGNRWDENAFAETVQLYMDVHRELEWPGVLEAETVHYGADAQQTFELYRPEQGFSEPGPVFVFLHGNGLGDSDRAVPGSDGLIWSHMGKLAATFGGIGLNMNYRTGGGDDAGAPLESGAEDLRLVIEWIVANIELFGGDPGTIVVLANAEGATTTAAYLFNDDWQTSSGPGIAVSILSSGHFGALEPAIAEMVSAYHGAYVPLALWSGEFDTAEVSDGIAALNEQLCGSYGHCPRIEQFEGHNPVSHIMSLGTDDTAVLNAFIRFYHTVR
jgi:acetyl esterase/lipase